MVKNPVYSGYSRFLPVTPLTPVSLIDAWFHLLAIGPSMYLSAIRNAHQDARSAARREEQRRLARHH